MYIFATFDHSTYLELALTAVEQQNISKENILAVPLNKRTEKRKLFDSIDASDGVSLFDLAAALATAFSVVGASIGFQLEWGPVIWGIIGAAGGCAAGLAIDFLTTRKKHKNQLKINNKSTEVILIIHCKNDQIESVKQTLWDNFAFGVAVLDHKNQSIQI